MCCPDGGQVVCDRAALERAGRDLARALEPGDVVLFRGEVGAGKSTMIRAVLRGLGVDGAIPSPTFTIGRSYEVEAAGSVVPDGCLRLSHLDLHRMGSIEDEDPGLLADYFGPDRIALVEWPEGREEYLAGLAGRLFEVRIAHRDEESRLLTPMRLLAARPGGPPERP